MKWFCSPWTLATGGTVALSPRAELSSHWPSSSTSVLGCTALSYPCRTLRRISSVKSVKSSLFYLFSTGGHRGGQGHVYRGSGPRRPRVEPPLCATFHALPPRPIAVPLLCPFCWTYNARLYVHVCRLISLNPGSQTWRTLNVFSVFLCTKQREQ